MDYISLAGIAVGLAMDAFAVSISNGASTRRVGPRFAVRVAASFGLFQALMPFLGWAVGKAGESFITSVDHWIALILLCFLGIQMLLETRGKDGSCGPMQDDLPTRTLLLLAVATSIDALATGVILPSAVGADTLPLVAVSVCAIGITTFFLCLLGVYIGKKTGCLLSTKAQAFGGIVLIVIGIKIFLDHTIL